MHFQLILATAGYDHTIKFWAAHTGVCTRTHQHPDSQVCHSSAITTDMSPQPSLAPSVADPDPHLDPDSNRSVDSDSELGSGFRRAKMSQKNRKKFPSCFLPIFVQFVLLFNLQESSLEVLLAMCFSY